jgi:hypothetical protein
MQQMKPLASFASFCSFRFLASSLHCFFSVGLKKMNAVDFLDSMFGLSFCFSPLDK